jgi:hypothetical protein
MGIKRYKPEEVVTKLRLFEVLRGQGISMTDAIRQIGATELTYYLTKSLLSVDTWLPVLEIRFSER